MTFKKIVALVPMRHHSQRVHGKNYRDLAGKPLFHYILQSLSACKEIRQIVVDTDSPVIMDGLTKQFPQVHILERPVHLQADDVSMNEILLYDTTQVEADLYLQTHSTNPLLQSETISRAIQTLKKNFPSYDSLFSVTRLQIRLWDALAKPINHNPDILLQTQDLAPVYAENSCIYLFTRKTLEKKQNRLGEHPFLFEIKAQEALDIDKEQDFLVAELLMKYLQNRKLV
ncbi:MAG TPA: acylneuraminate cytidylyltransferase family protein [Anaerolineae bacterium]|nr:acylneuraminate cytidylyltransferase family protein [Anaerolineae bacterium]